MWGRIENVVYTGHVHKTKNPRVRSCGSRCQTVTAGLKARVYATNPGIQTRDRTVWFYCSPLIMVDSAAAAALLPQTERVPHTD